MWNKIKEFFVSYDELCKASAEWMKKHWLGYIIVCCVIILPYWIYYLKVCHDVKKLRKEEEARMETLR